MSLEKHKNSSDYKENKLTEWKTGTWKGLAKPKFGSLKLVIKSIKHY